MSHSITEAAGYVAGGCTVPDDGDDIVAADLEQPIQELANRTKRHENMINGGGGPGITVTDITAQSTIFAGGFPESVAATGSIATDGDMFATNGTYTGLVTCDGIAIAGIASCAALSVASGVACGTISTSGVISCGGAMTVSGNLTTNGTNVFNGTTFVKKNVKRVLSLPNSDSTQIFANYDRIVNLVATANRKLTISDTGALDGMEVVVTNNVNFALDVYDPSNVLIVSMPAGAVHPKFQVLFRIGGNWIMGENNL